MSWTYQVQVQASANLRQYLQQNLLLPKHLIASLRKQYRVTVNGIYRTMNQQVIKGDWIELNFHADDFKHPYPHLIPDGHHAIEILYQTPDLIVVNKPAGIKTHPNQPHETGSMLNIAAAYLQFHHQLPYIVNRLDMWTSGALLFAKNPAVVPPLEQLIKTKQIQRIYLAWVKGNIINDTGSINLPIGRDPHDQRKRQINGLNAVNAITYYQVVKRTPTQTLLKLQLATGRTHQIRVHLAAIGHPIIADPLYNPIPSNQRLQLHSWQLKLMRPFTNETPLITAPLPADFQ